MKKLFSFVLGLLVASPLVVGAATILFPTGGGTGTGSIPSYGQVLVGNSGGTYTPTATSSLGITTFAFPFIPATNFNVNTSATSTPIWAQAGLFASTTSRFSNATSTLFSVTGSTWLPSLSSGQLNVGASGLLYSAASTTFSSPLVYTNGAVSLQASSNSQDGSMASTSYSRLGNAIATGILSGCVVSVNGGDNTKFDVSAGKVLIVNNYTDPTAPTYQAVNFAGATAVTPAASDRQITIAIDVNGAIQQIITTPTAAQNRQYAVAGRIAVLNSGVLLPASNSKIYAFDWGGTLNDLSLSLGTLNTSGNVFSANGSNLNVNRSAGMDYVLGGSSTLSSPNMITTNTGTAFTFTPTYQDGTGRISFGASANAIDPGHYDNGTGTLGTVAAAQFTNQWVIYFPASNTHVIAYGQVLYASMAAAVAGIQSEKPVLTGTNFDLSRGLVMAVISVKGNATVLNLTNKAVFTNGGIFGIFGPGGSAGSSATSLQGAYNASVAPQIITSATLGAIQMERGSASDIDSVFQILNGAGTPTFTVDGNGLATSTQASTTALTVTGSTWLPSITSTGLAVDANGLVYGAATTTFSTGLVYNNGVVTNPNLFPFTPGTNFNAAANATTSVLWLKNGLQASTTSQFSYSTTTMGSFVLASTTNLTISGLGNTSTQCLQITNQGVVSTTACGGSGTVTAVTGTWPLISSGGTAPNFTWGGLSTSSSPTIGNLSYWTGVNTLGTVGTTSISVTSAPFSFPSTLSAIGSGAGSWWGLSTTSNGAQGNIPYWTGVNTFGTIATGTITCSGTASCSTTGLSVIGGALTITGSGVTSVATNNGLTGGTITTTGTIGLATIAANSVLANQTSSSAVPTALATSSLYTFGSGFSNGNTLQTKEHRSFTYATSTAWTGTTTVPIEIGYGETWNTLRCVTSAGTLWVDVYHAATHLTPLISASTTKGLVTFTANNTMTDADTVYVDLGTPASSPTKITCTEQDTY